MQRKHAIPQPPLGATVTVVCLSSRASQKFNGKRGTVVAPDVPKSGRVPVLLDDGVTPLSFKLMNLRLHKGAVDAAGAGAGAGAGDGDGEGEGGVDDGSGWETCDSDSDEDYNMTRHLA